MKLPLPLPVRVFLAALFAAAPAASVSAQDMTIANGKIAVCIACHSHDGVSSQPIYPHIAGQYAEYLVKSLTAYRDGTRTDPLMSPMAAGLTDEEIKQLADHYAAQKFVPPEEEKAE